MLKVRGAKRVHKRCFELRDARGVSCWGKQGTADSMRYCRHPPHKRRDDSSQAARRPSGPDSAIDGCCMAESLLCCLPDGDRLHTRKRAVQRCSEGGKRTSGFPRRPPGFQATDDGQSLSNKTSESCTLPPAMCSAPPDCCPYCGMAGSWRTGLLAARKTLCGTGTCIMMLLVGVLRPISGFVRWGRFHTSAWITQRPVTGWTGLAQTTTRFITKVSR